jgi:hypothetical protein
MHLFMTPLLFCGCVASAKTEAEAGTQFTIFDSSALKKQCLIFFIFPPIEVLRCAPEDDVGHLII